MKIRHTPIYLICGFNLFTLIMYIISPFTHIGEGYFLSILFISINIIAISFGYFRGFSSGKKNTLNNYQLADSLNKSIFTLLSIFYALTFLIKYAYLLKFQIFDITGMIQHLMIGVINPKLGYMLSIEESRQATVSWSLYFAVSIINGIYFIAGFILWKSLSGFQRLFFIAFLVLELFYWVGRGTNFGIISLIFILIFAGLINNKGRVTFSYFIARMSLILFGLFSFSVIMYSRSEGVISDLEVFDLPQAYVNEDSFLFDVVPQKLHTTMLTVFSYLVQGYYNTAVAFGLDFNPSWFGGWNPSVQSIYSIIGFDISANTYIQRLDVYGIDPRINWHSSYTWFANDFSFYGVPFIMFILGYFVGYSWVKSISLDNDFASKLVFVFISVAMLFNFANNNFISYYFYSFMFIFPYWIYKNKVFHGYFIGKSL